MDDSLREDEESANKWRLELLRRFGESIALEHTQPRLIYHTRMQAQPSSEPVQVSIACTEEETFVVRKEARTVDYFVYCNPFRWGELLLDAIVVGALIFGIGCYVRAVCGW